MNFDWSCNYKKIGKLNLKMPTFTSRLFLFLGRYNERWTRE